MQPKDIHSIATLYTDSNYVTFGPKISFLSRVRTSIATTWVNLSNMGVNEEMRPSDIKRTRLTNLLALFSLCAMLIQLPVYVYLQLIPSIISITVMCLLMVSILLLMKHAYYSAAKTILFISIDISLVFASGYLGKDSGLYLYFFGLLILPFILLDLNEKGRIAFFILTTLASVCVIHFADFSAIEDKTITPFTREIIFLISLGVGFLSILFNVYSLVKENAISEAKLGESKNLFKGLLDATPDSTIITDNKGYITLCNKQVETILGYSPEELIGKSIQILFPSRLLEQNPSYFDIHTVQSRKNSEVQDYLLVAKKDGSEISVEISQNTYFAKSGKMMILVVRDMTERNKHEQELIQFSYVVSHDLKAPLRAIFKLSEWIEEELGPTVSGSLKKNLTFLRGRVFRLEALINGLLEYAKIGRTNIKKEKVNSFEMVSEVIELLAPPSTIRINIQQDMPVFETARTPFQQVFFNLLSNAIKYNDKPEGLINVSAKENKKFYEFSVEDNGIGIDPLYHEKVFVIFQTLEARDKVEGTGIGLAILKKSVEDMGGTVTLQSEPGKGSKFTFTWPKA